MATKKSMSRKRITNNLRQRLQRAVDNSDGGAKKLAARFGIGSGAVLYKILRTQTFMSAQTHEKVSTLLKTVEAEAKTKTGGTTMNSARAGKALTNMGYVLIPAELRKQLASAIARKEHTIQQAADSIGVNYHRLRDTVKGVSKYATPGDIAAYEKYAISGLVSTAPPAKPEQSQTRPEATVKITAPKQPAISDDLSKFNNAYVRLVMAEAELLEAERQLYGLLDSRRARRAVQSAQQAAEFMPVQSQD
jgi:transposase-like protein